MSKMESKVIWFVIGSQYLYGLEILEQVVVNVVGIVKGLNVVDVIFVYLIKKEVVIMFDSIQQFCLAVNNDQVCIGIIVWMYIFFFVKMWIWGLQ